jgi:hypothetical protein
MAELNKIVLCPTANDIAEGTVEAAEEILSGYY